MKNVHILPTDKPTILHFDSKLFLSTNPQISRKINSIVEGINIYITNDEEIKEGDYYITPNNSILKSLGQMLINVEDYKKIIQTTDQYLIKDGVEVINDDFLEWFMKNPSCESVEVVKTRYDGTKSLDKYWSGEYKIIIPKEEAKQENDYTALLQPVGTKQETLEEVAEIWVNNRFTKQIKDEDIYASKSSIIESHILFAKWQQERSYSEEEALNLLTHFAVEIQRQNKKGQYPIEIKGWFERNKETFKKK
jgi:hypothetical protein